MSHPSHVELSKLSVDTINVRKTDRGADPALVASIKAKGVIVPLTVRPNLSDDGFYTVTDGGKRYAALVALVSKKDIDLNYQVPIVVRDEDDQAARDTRRPNGAASTSRQKRRNSGAQGDRGVCTIAIFAARNVPHRGRKIRWGRSDAVRRDGKGRPHARAAAHQ